VSTRQRKRELQLGVYRLRKSLKIHFLKGVWQHYYGRGVGLYKFSKYWEGVTNRGVDLRRRRKKGRIQPEKEKNLNSTLKCLLNRKLGRRVEAKKKSNGEEVGGRNCGFWGKEGGRRVVRKGFGEKEDEAKSRKGDVPQSQGEGAASALWRESGALTQGKDIPFRKRAWKKRITRI